MKNTIKLGLFALAVAFTAASCSQAQDAANAAGEAVENTADAAGEVMDSTAAGVEDAANAAGEAVESVTE